MVENKKCIHVFFIRMTQRGRQTVSNSILKPMPNKANAADAKSRAADIYNFKRE